MDTLFTKNNYRHALLFEKYLLKWSEISQFNKILSTFPDVGVSKYREYLRETFELMKPGNEFDKYLESPEDFFDENNFNSLLDNLSSIVVEKSINIGRSSYFVYAHSIIDGLLEDLLSFAFDIDYQVYESFIYNSDYKFKLKELKKLTIDEFIKTKTKSKLKSILNQSLLNKSEKFHKICKDQGFNSGKYKFSPEKIKSFDDTRHNIVHDLNFVKTYKDIESDLDYMYWLGFYYSFTFMGRFNLKFIPSTNFPDNFTN